MQQKAKDREFVSSWYQEKVRQFGENDPRSLGYNQRSSQVKRFDVLCQLGDFNGRRILDVGCGLGDFYKFLNDRGIETDYTGFDLCPDMIQSCKSLFKDKLGPWCRFETGDTLEYNPVGSFDYVVASGIFGLMSENAEERILPTIKRMFSWCRVGTAVNLLSNRTSRQAQHCLYVDPAKILSQAMELTPSVELKHSYLPNDFTLYLYKTPAWELEKEAAAVEREPVAIRPPTVAVGFPARNGTN
jgi:SAM-dependent methyltransferase